MDEDELLKNADYVSMVEKIIMEVPYVDIKPYSHNIIGLLLNQIAQTFGTNAANKVIDDYELEKLGWEKVKTD